MSFRRRALFLAGLFVAVSCSDAGNPLEPGQPKPPTLPEVPGAVQQTLTCTVFVDHPDMRCTEANPSTGSASGAIFGGVNGEYVKLIKIGHNVNADSMWFNVRVQNLFGQPLGVDSTGAVDPTGVRLFFATGPNATSGPGDVEVDTTTTGEAFLFSPETPYYQYAGMLAEADTSEEVRWKFKFTGGTTSFTFTVIVDAPIRYPQGWLDITPDSANLMIGEVDSLHATVRNLRGQGLVEGVDWASSDTNYVKVTELTDSTASVTGIAQGQAWVRAVSQVDGVRRDSILVKVKSVVDSMNALTNVSVRLSSQRLRQGLAAGDSVLVDTIDTAHGQAIIGSDRSLAYVSDGGYFGADTIVYDVRIAGNTVQNRLAVKVAPTNYWFVQPSAGGDGSNTRPFSSISAAATAADVGDTIFVLRDPSDGSNPVVGAAVLDANQALIGHGVANTFFLADTALNEPARVDTIFQGKGLGTPLMNTGAPTLTVAANNLVRGVNVSSADAAAIHGVGFGTLTVGEITVQAGGPALSLLNGTLAGVFTALHSTSSDSAGLSLQNVGGTPTITASTISGAGAAGIDIRNSTGTFSFPALSSVTNNLGAALYVAGGTPTVTYAGTISSTNGNPGFSRPLFVDGLTGGAVTVSGAVSNTGPGILIEDNTGGTVTVSGNIDVSGNAGQGILVQNNVGTANIQFTGSSKHIHPTANIVGVYLLNNTGATITFAGGGLNIDMPSGSGANSSGFVAQGGGTVTVTGANNEVDVMGAAVEVTNTTIGAAGISLKEVRSSLGTLNRAVQLTSTGAGGFQVTGAGGVAGSGGSITSVDTAVFLSNVGGPVELAYLNVSGGVNTGVVANTFNTITFTDNSLTASGGPVLHLTGGALAGSVSSLSATNSLTSSAVLTNVTGSLTATLGGMSVSAGAGAGPVFLVDGGSVSVSYGGGLTGVAATPMLRVANGHTGTLAFTGLNTMSLPGSPGMRFENADGTYNISVTAGSTTLSGDSVGIDILAGNDATNGSQGTFQFGSAAGGFSITNAAGTAFNFQGSAADVTFHGGITKNGTQTGRMVDITGQKAASAISFLAPGTLSATSSSLQSTGILLNDADGTVSFNGTTALGNVGITTGDAGIDVENGSSGTITFGSNSSVVNAVGELIRIASSAPTFTYSGTFQRTTGNAIGILAQNNTGGTITFNGDGTTLDGDPADVTKSLSTGTSNAVSLVTNTSTTIQFGGGMTLATGTGTALNATGGGTVTVTGAGNTVNTTGGSGVNIQNTTIGGSGVSLLSVTASGGANGIALVNTGAGGLQVTGGSTHGSGGTIANTTGADGAIAGNGVYLDNATNVNLSWMNFSGHANHAVRGSSVSNVTLTRVRITGSNGTNAGSDEGSVSFSNLTGSGSITSSYIEGGFEDNVRVVNTSGTLNRFTMSSDTIGHNGSSGNAGVLLNGFQTAVVNATVQNSRFTGSRSNNIAYVINENASGDVLISGNTLTNNHPNKLGSDFGIYVAHASSGNVTYSVASNSVNNAGGAGIEVDRGAGGTGTMTGTINANTVGTAGVANSGSFAGSGIFVALVGTGTAATHNTTISNNTVRQFTNYGIEVLNNGTGNGYLNASVTGNNIAEPSPNATALFGVPSGMRFVMGTSSGPPAHDGRTCLNITGNTVTQTGTAASAEIRLFGRFSTRTGLPGLTGAGANALIAGQNTITPAGGATAVNATSTNAFQSTCPPV